VTETVYKFVRVDGRGRRLCSPLADGRWQLSYELGHCTVPQCEASLLFAWRRREDALDAWRGDPVKSQVQLYEATASACLDAPVWMPLLVYPEDWQEYWLWFKGGMSPQLRNPAWKLYQPPVSLVLCQDLTLLRQVW